MVSAVLLGAPSLDRSLSEELSTMPAMGEEVAVMETSEGRIVLMFYPQVAPKHVRNFKTLAKKKFYDGTRFHRTMEGFMIQGGDPNSRDLSLARSWGTGGNRDDEGREINVPAEFSDMQHLRGVLSMARSQDPNSASSQFFVMHADALQLDGQYSAFGRVIEGIDVVDKIASKPAGNNGQVVPGDAVVLISVRIVKWGQEKSKKKPWTINGWGGIG